MTGTLSVQRNLELLGRYRYLKIQMSVLEGQHPVGVRFNETINAR